MVQNILGNFTSQNPHETCRYLWKEKIQFNISLHFPYYFMHIYRKIPDNLIMLYVMMGYLFIGSYLIFTNANGTIFHICNHCRFVCDDGVLVANDFCYLTTNGYISGRIRFILYTNVLRLLYSWLLCYLY